MSESQSMISKVYQFIEEINYHLHYLVLQLCKLKETSLHLSFLYSSVENTFIGLDTCILRKIQQ